MFLRRESARLKSAILFWLIAAVSLGLSGCGTFQDEPAPVEAADGGAVRDDGIAYSVELHGTLPGGMRGTMEAVIAANKANANVPPPNEAFLKRRMQDLATQLNKVLRAQGYYNGDIEIDYTRNDANEPIVNFVVAPGPQSVIETFTIDYQPEPGDAPDLAHTGEDLGLGERAPALTQRIIDLTDEAVKRLKNTGFPFAKLVNRRVVVDLTEHQAEITLIIDPGARFDFGEFTISGLTKTKESYVRKQLAFTDGERFDQSELDTSIRAIRDLGLFNLVSYKYGEPKDGRLPIHVEVGERDHRTIGAGLKWSTNDGFGTRVFWEHRDLFGAAETLKLDLDIQEVQQAFTASFSKPQFRRKDQELVAAFEIANEDTNAYQEQRVTTSIGIQRRLSQTLRGGLGLTFQLLRSDDNDETNNYQLFGVPGNLKLDTTDSLFDPTEGVRGSLNVTPYTGLGGGQPLNFVRTEATLSHYWALIGKNKLIWANRVRAGSDLAAGNVPLPGSLRFYAGGGGSVRGYGYQEIGPLDSNGDPEGGISVTEISTEFRYRAFENIGFVTFLDGGSVSETVIPTFSEGYYWGTGVGFRYYTPIGPVRADLGFPLRRRNGIDDFFQIYISIGQAF